MYLMEKALKINLRIASLDHHKMTWLAQHDDTSVAWQYRKAVKGYLHARKTSVYAIHGKDPINDKGENE